MMNSIKVKIAIKNVSLVYPGPPEIKALEGASLNIDENKFVSIVGRSGCGKTTLLRIVAGFVKPTTGQVLCDGHIVDGPNPSRAVVFQEDAVFPWMSLEKNVEFGLIAKKMEKKERQEIVTKFIKLVGLEGFRNTLPKALSGGMRKRVDLARAYAVNPEVLLMDEPLGSLDAQTKFEMQTQLLRICAKEKKTVLFVTHDLSEAVYLSDIVVVLSARPGRVKKIIEIDLPRPRESTVKFSRRFSDLERYAWELVQENSQII